MEVILFGIFNGAYLYTCLITQVVTQHKYKCTKIQQLGKFKGTEFGR